MLHSLSVFISDYFKKLNLLKADQEIYTYGVELLLGDILNLVILFIIACLLNRTLEMMIWSVVFLLSRKYAGGYHAQSHIICILTLQIGFILSFLICENLNPDSYMWYEIAIAGLGFPILNAIGPIGSPKKPIKYSSYRKKKKALTMFSIIVTVGFLLIIFLFSGIKILLYAFSSYLFVIMLVPAGYIDNKIKCKNGMGLVSTDEHLQK